MVAAVSTPGPVVGDPVDQIGLCGAERASRRPRVARAHRGRAVTQSGRRTRRRCAVRHRRRRERPDPPSRRSSVATTTCAVDSRDRHAPAPDDTPGRRRAAADLEARCGRGRRRRPARAVCDRTRQQVLGGGDLHERRRCDPISAAAPSRRVQSRAVRTSTTPTFNRPSAGSASGNAVNPHQRAPFPAITVVAPPTYQGLPSTAIWTRAGLTWRCRNPAHT